MRLILSKKASVDKQYILHRRSKIIVISAILIVIGCGCLAFPFYFETTTVWYKFGTDKIILQIGQACGLLTFVLLCIQIVLATRTNALDQLLGAGKRIRLHRLNGIIIAILVSIHILLILIPEGLTNLPFGKKYWPEMVGGFSFSVIIFTLFVSQFRQQLRLKYNNWKSLHKPLGYLIVAGSAIHIYFVSDAFEQAIPKLVFFTFLVGLALWVTYVKLKPIHKQK